MDNEGLLAWAEYEVAGAWMVLKRAEMNRDELRKIVKNEKDKEAYDIDALTLKVCAFIEQETERIRRETEAKAARGY